MVGILGRVEGRSALERDCGRHKGISGFLRLLGAGAASGRDA